MTDLDDKDLKEECTTVADLLAAGTPMEGMFYRLRGYPQGEIRPIELHEKDGRISVIARRDGQKWLHRPEQCRVIMEELATAAREDEDAVREALMEYAANPETLEDRGASIKEGDLWLAGSPFMWSMFSDRAFMFKNANDAQKLIDDHPKYFQRATVKEWGKL